MLWTRGRKEQAAMRLEKLRSTIAILAWVPCLIGLASLWEANAQSTSGLTPSDYERESENPVTRFYTLPLRYKASFDDGFYGGTTNSVEVSNALVPMRLDNDWFLIARSKGAFVSQAPKSQGLSWGNGLNNAQTTLFLSPAHGHGFYWGVGPVISFPTATNSATGTNHWGAGPSIAFTWQRAKHWTIAFVANNVWGLGGASSSNLLLNPIVSYRFGDGWSVSTSPNITANLASHTDKRWTVPVGAGIGKALILGAQPASLKLEAYYNPVRTERASTWVAQLTLTFLFAT
jgi:hypothetical protein